MMMTSLHRTNSMFCGSSTATSLVAYYMVSHIVITVLERYHLSVLDKLENF